jgi:hypothetical protein
MGHASQIASGDVQSRRTLFRTKTPEEETNKPVKRGIGRQKKSKVLVMAESIPLEGEVSGDGKPRKAGYIKMFVIEDLKSVTIDKHVTESIDKESI